MESTEKVDNCREGDLKVGEAELRSRRIAIGRTESIDFKWTDL